jgi:hypothetical protein
MSDDEKPRIEINWVQTMAGALAAVTSAVLLSTFGVAGTLIGAALGSLALTIGNAVYSYSLRLTRERVAAAQSVAAARIGLAQSRVRGGADAEDLAEVVEDLDQAQAVLEDAAEEDEAVPGGWRAVLAGLPWKRIAAISTAIFVIAMLAILAFELVTGRAVSTYTGGSEDDRRTSIPGMGGGADRDSGTTPDPRPGDDATTDSGEEDLLVPEAETTAPGPSPTPGDTETEAPTEAPTADATPEPTVLPEPTPTAETSP